MSEQTNEPPSERQAQGQGLQVGERAPDFTLPDANGTPVRLSDYLGKRAVVLYFYPKDEMRGCTVEACAFRDSYEVFKQAGAEVIGVSADSPESHREFAAHHRLPFVLLSDPDGVVRKRYKATAAFGLLPGRVTYVIDKQGVIRNVFSSQMQFEQHAEEALRTLQSL